MLGPNIQFVEAQADLPTAGVSVIVAGPGPSVAEQLPAGLTGAPRFVGREGELAELADLLRQARTSDTAAVSAVSGTAGVGKTALAVHWARQAAAEFPDGQLYLDLRGSGPSRVPVEPAEAVTAFLHALGVAPDQVPESPDAQGLLYHDLLAGKRVLLVLDNASSAEQVRPLLPAETGCLAIVTSRNPLAGLADLGTRVITLNVLTQAQASDLMAASLGPERLAAEPAAVAELTRLCDGLPLALAIATAQVRARAQLALAFLAAELRDTAGQLAAPDAADLAPGLRAVLTWSRANLTPAAAEMFRLLGLHPGRDITAPAAASLAGTSLSEAHEQLGELTGRQLLTEPVPGRYALHDLIRAYAAEQAATSGDASAGRAALARVLDHYLRTAHTAALLVNPSREPIELAPAMDGVPGEHLADYQQALAWFEAERHALLSAAAVAADAGFGVHAWQIAWAMTDFLNRRGFWLDLAAVSRVALAAATRLGDVTGQATASRMVALTSARAGDYDQARRYLTDCLSLCRQIGNRALEARVYQTLGWVSAQEDRYFDSLSYVEQALALFRATGNRAGEALALNNIGYCHLRLGDRRLARTFCEQAVLIQREEGSTHGEAIALDSLGDAEHQLGRHTEAIACYQRAIGLFRELGERYGEAETLVHLGDATVAAGLPQEAHDAWRQALAIFDDLRHSYASQVRRRLSVTPSEAPPPLA